MPSISTEIWLGSDPMPTAERRVPAVLAEYLDEQIGHAVGDLGVVLEVQHGVDHAEHLQTVSTRSSDPSAIFMAERSCRPDDAGAL